MNFEQEPSFDLNKKIAELEARKGKGNVSEAKFGDSAELSKTHPDLQSFSIKLRVGERGPDYLTVYYTKDEKGTVDVLLVDMQYGNYEGGPVWEKGGSPEHLQKLFENIY